MKKLVTASIASALLLSLSTLAYSDMPMGKDMGMDKGMTMMMGAEMTEMDMNKDGKISKDEFTKHHDQMFTQTDKNADGMIDAGERAAMKDQKMKDMKGMHGKDHGKDHKDMNMKK